MIVLCTDFPTVLCTLDFFVNPVSDKTKAVRYGQRLRQFSVRPNPANWCRVRPIRERPQDTQPAGWSRQSGLFIHCSNWHK